MKTIGMRSMVRGVAVAVLAAVAVSAETVLPLEDFDGLDPSTDSSGSGSSNLCGQGQ